MLLKEELKERLKAIIDEVGETGRHRQVKRKIAELEKATDYTEWEVEYERQFEKNCAIITEQMHKDAKGMTVMEYYTAMNILADRVKEQEKRDRKLKSK